MADNVQWIRLIVGMFDGNSFKKIKRAKIGGVSYRDKLTAVWFELLDLAGKSNANGYLIDNNEIPYQSFEDIATMLDREEKEVELCMQFFINEKMVEIVDDVYCLTNFAQYQNQDGLAQIREKNRLRQIKCREKKKQALLGCSNNSLSRDSHVTSNVTSQQSHAVEIDIDEDIDIIHTNAGACTREENLDLLDYNEFLLIVKEECPIVFNRHQAKVDNGKLQIVREVTQILEQLQGQYSYKELREIFRKASKTFCVKPSYSSCDIKWVLNNISRVLAEEKNETESTEQTETAPKGVWDEMLENIGRIDKKGN